jgi:hypothetical protein
MSILLKFYTFDRKGWRWLLSFSCTLASFIKTGKINFFKYDKKNKRWFQFHNKTCFFVDKKPDWNIDVEFLYKRTSEFCLKQYSPTPNDIIIDIGAGVGTETFVFSKIANQGKIYAIEAHPETYFSLKLLKEKSK